jgi:pimeloyl-ACP methyl ester carboxylesterase
MEDKKQFFTSFATFAGHYSEAKDTKAPLMVFLHGFPDDAKVWSFQWESFKDTASLWAPDLYTHPFQNQVKGVAEVIEEMAEGREVILVAHDMGGPVAFDVAGLYPGLVSKLLFVNSLGVDQFISRLKDPEQLMRSSYMLLFSGPLHNTKLWKRWSTRFIEAAYNKGGLSKDDPLRNNSPEVIEGIRRYREIMKEVPERLRTGKKAIKVPTYFIYGEDDPFLKLPSEKELHDHFEVAALETLKASHWPQRTHASEISDWIKKVVWNG